MPGVDLRASGDPLRCAARVGYGVQAGPMGGRCCELGWGGGVGGSGGALQRGERERKRERERMRLFEAGGKT